MSNHPFHSAGVLSVDRPLAWFQCGELDLRYELDTDKGLVSFLPLPAGWRERCLTKRSRRPSHPVFEGRDLEFAWIPPEREQIVQLAIRGMPLHPLWQAGETYFNHSATETLRFTAQQIKEHEQWVDICTILQSPVGFEIRHLVRWPRGHRAVLVSCELRNTGTEPLEVDYLTSFCLSGITPFAPDDAPGRLVLHRFRSVWSNEAYHSQDFLESLNMERSWGGGPRSLVISQTGSLPVRKFHPFLAVEDRQVGVIWGAHLAWHGSWQMELYRRADSVSLSGGLADYQRAHWMKRLQPGESLTTPQALVSAWTGCLDGFCHGLVRLMDWMATPEPARENDLPGVFNEWCSTWGKPTHDLVIRTADALKGTRTTYLVIDDGWADKPEGEGIQFNGDWNVNLKAFPQGLAATCAAIRQRGLIPGIWFEFEPCTRGTEAHKQTAHHLHLHGRVIDVGTRRFWDFRDPWVWDYMREKLIRLLRECGFGYLKVDYNDSIGLGCDGAESPGEGLRQHLIKVREFFESLRQEVPGLVIENCASGGHRLEPGMVSITSMSSFSDAHETVEIPIIAASLHRLMPARKIQIWAVLRPEDDARRLHYSLAALLLGRQCLSGDLTELAPWQHEAIIELGRFYEAAMPVIRDGESRLRGHTGPSRRYPEGWQALVRAAGPRRLVVLHTFATPKSGPRPHELAISLDVAEHPLPPDTTSIPPLNCFAEPQSPARRARLQSGKLLLPNLPDFSAAAWLL